MNRPGNNHSMGKLVPANGSLHRRWSTGRFQVNNAEQEGPARGLRGWTTAAWSLDDVIHSSYSFLHDAIWRGIESNKEEMPTRSLSWISTSHRIWATVRPLLSKEPTGWLTLSLSPLSTVKATGQARLNHAEDSSSFKDAQNGGQLMISILTGKSHRRIHESKILHVE